MTIEPEDLGRPASLTLWSSEPDAPKAVEPKDYATLREALRQAGIAMSDDSAAAWIITESGLILSPAWLRRHLAADAVSSAGKITEEPSHRRGRLVSALPAMSDQSGRHRLRRAAGFAQTPAFARERASDAVARS